MTDKRSVGVRHVSDSREKMKTQTRVIGVRQSHHASYSGRKAFTTPKRRSRARLNGCYSGDSPSETESPQDIIWDSSSPMQSFNGDARVIEISEIVNRIAPKVERSKEGDSILQWIGDSAVPCTPEIRQPRLRRTAARQSNVEDLKKLAKQFDINMTRQESTEKRNKLSKLHSEGTAAVSSEQLTGRSYLARQEEEEELQALFDVPTQHISGKLSPPSLNCTLESSTEPPAQAGQRKSKKTPVDAPKFIETKFDDDWDNDDFMNDSFVLEITQNPVPLNVAQKQSTTLSKSCSKKCNFEAKVNPSISNSRNLCFETQESTNKSCTFSKTLPDVQTSNQSTFKLKQPTSEQNHSNDKLLKISSVNQEKLQTQPGCRSTRPAKLDRMTKDCGVSRQTSSDADMKSLFDSDGLWNDKDDDDLLCQACHDVEKLSSQEQHNYKNPAYDKPRIFASKASSSSDPVCSQSTNSRGQSRDPTRSMHVFARSNSVPCTSGSSGFKQGLLTTKSSSSVLGSHGDAQSKSSQVKNLLEFAGSTGTSQTVMPRSATSDSHHYILKRHLSESVARTNKVFIPSHTTARCSAAEIERKKQEAIARRRLRILASQKMEHLHRTSL